MNKLKMVLADKTEVELREFSLPMHAVVTCASNDEVLATWKLLTQENLRSVTIMEGEEEVLNYQYAGLSGVQCIDNLDGTLTAHFYMEGERIAMSQEDAAYIEAAKILLGEEE